MRDAIREQINRLESVNQNLQQKEERLSAFIRAMPDAIYVFNQQGECEEVLVPREGSLFQPPGNDGGKSAEDHFCDAMPAEFTAAIHQTLRTGLPQVSEFELDSNGKTHWFEGRLSPMRNANGGTELVICLVRDITHQKEAAAMNKARIEAQAANEAKSVFLATMSHEIRTPMNAILGMADLLWESQLTTEQKKYVSIFRNAGENLLSIINDILDLSKIESGHLSLNEKPFNIVDTIERVCENLAFQAHEKKIELICSMDAQVPTELVGDLLRLRQVLFNLVANAIKFTSSGEIEVSVVPCQQDGESTHPPTRSGDAGQGVASLLFSVRDTGYGIAEELLEKIFDRFTQAEPYSTRKFGGTGLGLTICKHLVQMMNGRIWVDKTSEHGTTFKFTACFGSISGQRPVQPPTGPSAAPLRVLVADGNRTCLQSMRSMIESFGIEVETADTGTRLMELISATQPGNRTRQILFIDAKLSMPEKFREMVAVHRKANPAGFKVFLLISHNRKDYHDVFERIGVDAYFIKPLRRSELLSAMDHTSGSLLSGHIGSEAYERVANPFVRPLRILLVEDNVNNQMLFIYYLKAFCHPIDVAENGQQGVERFKSTPYDVVFMDLAMPVMDGYEATRAIRLWESEHARSPIPIIALTADALIGREQKSIDAGCTVHITKPFTKAQILDALVQTLPADMLKSENSVDQTSYIEIIDADLNKLIPSFFYNTQEDIKKLKQAVEIKDWPTLERLGHGIKGSSFGYGFMQLGQIGQQIEKAAKEKVAKYEIDELIKKLIDYTENVQIKFVERHQHNQEKEMASFDKPSAN